MEKIQDMAASLYDGGWRAEDKEQFMAEHELTAEEAEAICEILRGFEVKKLVTLINNLDLKGVSARYTEPDFILEVDGLLEERFDNIEEMSETLNARSRVQNSDRLDEIDQTICEAARKAGLL